MPTTPPPPDDDDLTAYLDGELDDATAEQVESELARNPAARAKADELKKTYDLLGYLPAPEPSPTFASRTVTALQPIAGGSRAVPTVPPPRRRRVWLEVVAWVVLVGLAGGVAFAGHRALRQPAPKPAEELPLSDLAVIEHLPLYAGVDDIEFARVLAREDLFDDPPTADAPRRDTLTAADRDKLIEQFRGFPPARQQQLRTLHQKLTDPATPDRAALVLAVEGYAVWLARLPDDDRKRVFDARPEERAEAVRQVRERRWREGLPAKQQEALRHVADPEEKQVLLQTYRGHEVARREEWEFAQRQWKEGKDKAWPFYDAELAPQVDRYVKTAFGVDPAHLPLFDRKGDKPEVKADWSDCRLTREEVVELRDRREAAVKDGYWYGYGAVLLRLSDKYPTLPRPKTGEPITRPNQLPKGYAAKDGGGKLKVGKWPDFALDVMAATKDAKGNLDPLGPCKPDEFTPAVKEFVEKKLTDDDRKALSKHLGKWPDYPRELLRLAREKNLSVPDVTLPGDPAKWRQFYQLPPTKK